MPGGRPRRILVGLRPAAVRNRWGCPAIPDRKSTRLNSSHSQISYAVLCLKKKLNNLLLNASQAKSDPGNIDIKINCVGHSFEVSVVDDGIEIHSGICSTLFDPFLSSGKSD